MDKPPHLNEFKGACSEKGRFKLELLTEGYPTAKELRNIIKILEVTAAWLAEDEQTAIPESSVAVTNGEDQSA
jgi:hypothetical protein